MTPTGGTQRAKFNISVIPSMFLPYPGMKIFIERYGLGELRIFSESDFTDRERIDFVLKGIHIDGFFDKYDLTYADYGFLATQRKVITFGKDTFSIPWHCPKCNKTSISKVPNSEILYDELKIPKLPIKVKFSFGEAKFRPLTIRKFLQRIEEGDGYSINTLALMASESPSEYHYMKDMFTNVATMADGELLVKVDKMLFHGLKPVNVTCENTSFTDNDNIHGVTYKQLYEMDIEELTEFAEKNSILIPDTATFMDRLNKIVRELKIADLTICGHKQKEDLGDGDLLIYPFRESGTDIDSAISFGD